MSTVTVSRKGEARIVYGHPWIFRSDIARADNAGDGAVVKVVSQQGRPLGHAFHSSRSEIRLRMLTRSEALSPGFLAERLDAALEWRKTIAAGAEAYRIVHGEGDGLPSLVVDRYGEYLVLQTLSQATEAMKDQVVAHLVRALAPKGILERNDPRVRTFEGLEQRVGLLHGEVPEVVEITENGIRYEADLWKGQKTGLFLDQRENHAMAGSYARGRVLDAFTYNGGFGLQVAAQSNEVLAVDVSADALARVKRNAERNGITNVVVQEGNVFDVLHELDAAGQRFDTVILDPPAFAKSKDAVEKARRGYKEINLRALRILNPGGILITCSCSYHVHEADLEEILVAAAVDARASVVVVEKRRQGRDHPVLLGVPETYYLKCFVLRKLAAGEPAVTGRPSRP
jgi:23S rRNA (cytosine1962-C5)-methyltransferase